MKTRQCGRVALVCCIAQLECSQMILRGGFGKGASFLAEITGGFDASNVLLCSLCHLLASSSNFTFFLKYS